MKLNILIVIFYCLIFIIKNSYSKEASISKSFQLIGQKNFINDYNTFDNDNNLNVVIEIPSGTNEKWEVSKDGSKLELEFNNGLPRIIDYIGYPFNYGFAPKTLLSSDVNGDGDQLDVIVLSQKNIKRGDIISAKIIGMYLMTDNEKIDNKIISVQIGSRFENINSLKGLNIDYPGILEIIEIWFKNYKGFASASNGFVEKKIAKDFINKTKNSYERNKSKNK